MEKERSEKEAHTFKTQSEREKERERREKERETTDRNACPRGRMSQRLIKSARPRRESRRCRGTLVVLASMGKGQQIH